MQVVGLTHTGRERSRNEDSYLALSKSGVALLAVADGMGGHQAGNVASYRAIEVLGRFWAELDSTEALPQDGLAEIVQNLVMEANRLILDESNVDTSKQGMGTTLTTALLSGDKLFIGHVGDSRAYLIEGGRITLLTEDHSLLEQMLQHGSISPEEAEGHPQRHILTRALGTNAQVEVDLLELKLEKETTLLLCSDGLTSLVKDEEILGLVKKSKGDLNKMASTLIQLANERGGYDNITVVIATDVGRQAG